MSGKPSVPFGNPESSEPRSWPGPGGITDATDEQLRIFRRTVIEPVVNSLLSSVELGDLSVHWGTGGDPGDVWVCLSVGGERFQGVAHSLTWYNQQSSLFPVDLLPSAGQLASQLQ